MIRIYLDNAATSWPKPEAVYQAVDDYQRNSGASAGRSSYQQAVDVGKKITLARKGVANLIGCNDPRRIVLTFNGTDSLNLAIAGLLREDDHVITSVAEHNSVLRPLRYLQDSLGISVTRVGCDAQGFINPADVSSALQENTRLVAIIHASNVTGVIQPAAEIGEIMAQHPGYFLIDAAQSLGHLEIDVNRLQVDLLASSGHKGLLGPLGTGVLYIKPGVEEHLNSIRQGGTGTQSDDDRQPSTLPEKYETGNHNTPGLVGLAAAVEYLQKHGVGKVREHEMAMTEVLIGGLSNIPNVTIHGPTDLEKRVAVVSFSIEGYDPQEVAALLDSGLGGDFHVQVRAGVHCAPLMHQALNTSKQGGTIRLSAGPFTTVTEIEQTVQAIELIASSDML